MTAAAAGDAVVPHELVARGGRVIGVAALPRGVTIRRAPASNVSLPPGDALFELVRNGRVIDLAPLPSATTWVRLAPPSAEASGVAETNAPQQVKNQGKVDGAMNVEPPSCLRIRLLNGGYAPIPVMGKAPQLKSWQQKFDTNPEEIRLWDKLFPYAQSTGVLTCNNPAFDIDIRDEPAAQAVEDLVREWLGDREGEFLVRVGKAPKRAILFQTTEPFSKIQISLQAPDGSTDPKLEFLGGGQQIVVLGIHPETQQPYIWHGGRKSLATHSPTSRKPRRESLSRPLPSF
jgi:hypothetical protein